MMKARRASLLLLGLAIIGLTSNEACATAVTPNEAPTSATEGSFKFALDLYMKLKDEYPNLILSPLSVQIVSAMLAGGAKENTWQELKKVMYFPDEKDLLRSGYKNLLQHLKAPQLQMANRIFPEKDLKLNPAFRKEVVDYYSSEIDPLPFSDDPNTSAKRINDWAYENTNGKITNIVKPDELSSTLLVLANAVYFKAKWQFTFQASSTRDQKFYTSTDSNVMVKMMRIKNTFGYAHIPDIEAKVLEMPYEGGQFRMVVILPDNIEGLPQVENKLHQLGISNVLKRLKQANVEVELPRFKIESTLDLVEPLKKLGLKDLFTKACNLTGVFDASMPVRVGKVAQKAFIEVNEEGTEAAAVTVSQILTYSLLEVANKRTFIVDRPAIVLVTLQENTVLFIARISKP